MRCAARRGRAVGTGTTPDSTSRSAGSAGMATMRWVGLVVAASIGGMTRRVKALESSGSMVPGAWPVPGLAVATRTATAMSADAATMGLVRTVGRRR